MAGGQPSVVVVRATMENWLEFSTALLLLLQVVLTGSGLVRGETTAICKRCSVEPDIPCEVKEACQVPGRDDSAPEVGPVSNLRQYAFSFPNDDLYVNVSWDMSATDFTNVTGYKVYVTSSSPKLELRCYVLKFTRTPTDTSAIQRVRTTFCDMIHWATRYTYHVETLPNLPGSGAPSVEVPPKKRPGRVALSESIQSTWKTAVAVELDSDNQRIDVKFRLPANLSLFDAYNVRITNKDHLVKREYILNTTTQFRLPVSFTNVCEPGHWKAWVEPLGKYGQCTLDPQLHCLDQDGLCDVCIQSVSEEFWFLPVSHCGEIPFRVQDAMEQLIALTLGLSLGCFVLALCVTLVIVKCRFWDPNQGESLQSSSVPLQETPEQPVNNRPKRGTMRNVDRKRLLILYHNDHPLHEKVIHLLATFLQQNCKCDVILDEWEIRELRKDHLSWITKNMDMAHKVLFIHSEGGFRRYTGMEKGVRYESKFCPKVDLFVPAVKIVRRARDEKLVTFSPSKNIVAYMPYTPRKFVIAETGSKQQFPLMDELEPLFYQIHGLSPEKDGVWEAAGKVNGSQYQQLPGGRNLATAIEKMKELAEGDPDWFYNTFSVSNSGDSGRGTLKENQAEIKLREFSASDEKDKCCSTSREHDAKDGSTSSDTNNKEDGSTSNDPNENGSKSTDLQQDRDSRDEQPIIKPPPAPPDANEIRVQPSTPKDNRRAAVERESSANRSKVSQLRASFEMKPSLGVQMRPAVAKKGRPATDRASENSRSPSSDRENSSATNPEVIYAQPVPKSARSSMASAADRNSQTDKRRSNGSSTPNHHNSYKSNNSSSSSSGGNNNNRSTTPSRPTSHASLADPIYYEVDEGGGFSRGGSDAGRKSKHSTRDYSAIVDNVFQDALSGQSTGEPSTN